MRQRALQDPDQFGGCVSGCEALLSVKASPKRSLRSTDGQGSGVKNNTTPVILVLKPWLFSTCAHPPRTCRNTFHATNFNESLASACAGGRPGVTRGALVEPTEQRGESTPRPRCLALALQKPQQPQNRRHPSHGWTARLAPVSHATGHVDRGPPRRPAHACRRRPPRQRPGSSVAARRKA